MCVTHRSRMSRLRLPVLGAASVALFGQSIPVDAQWWEPPRYREYREYRRPIEPQPVSRRKSEAASSISRPASGPMIAVVSLNDQRITIYDAEGRLGSAPVSSGSSGNETPVGLYTIIQKNRDHVSNLYDAEMPFMQRITWSGIALHAGVVPGYPASHGCVRLPYNFAEDLFEITNKGMRVVLVRQDMSPVDISHPFLFRPSGAAVASATPIKAEGEQPMRLGAGELSGASSSTFAALKAEAEAKAAAAEAATRRAEVARAQAYRLNVESGRDAKFLRGAEYVKSNLEQQLKIAEAQLAAAPTQASAERARKSVELARKRLDDANARLASIMAAPKVEAAEKARQDAAEAELERRKAVEEAAAAQRKLQPISVLVSRATQRLYVRQANEPVMDVPVVIKDADKPIGTTLFTAVKHEGQDVRWTALSMYPKGMAPDPAAPMSRQAQRFKVRSAEPTRTRPEDAKAVLDRIEIPDEARARISEVLAPGSSLIVSDETAHKETGGGTDFIMIMPHEPQGGIKIKAKPRERFFDDYDDDDRFRRRGRRIYNDDDDW